MRLIDRLKQGDKAIQTITVRGDDVEIHPLSDEAFARAVTKSGVNTPFQQLKNASADLLSTANLLRLSIAVCEEGIVGFEPALKEGLKGGISAEIAAKIIEITFGEGENVQDFSTAPKGNN